LTSGEFGPKKFARSGFVFSSTMFAVETSPTLHPARVNGTQGAGGVEAGEPAAGTVGEYGMFGNWAPAYELVQYANDECETTEPFGR
jgi:hypothetical protein